MIFLAITPEGLKKALEIASGHHHIWCGSDAVSESDEKCRRVSRFNYPLKGVDEEIGVRSCLLPESHMYCG